MMPFASVPFTLVMILYLLMVKTLADLVQLPILYISDVFFGRFIDCHRHLNNRLSFNVVLSYIRILN